jgi:hypothetical protein
MRQFLTTRNGVTDGILGRTYGLLASVALVACGTAADGSAVSDMPNARASVELRGVPGPRSHPEPLVSFRVGRDEEDKTIEFYKFSTGVLAMETGKADRALPLPVLPQFRQQLKAKQFAEIVHILRPEVQVPDGLGVRPLAGSGATAQSAGSGTAALDGRPANLPPAPAHSAGATNGTGQSGGGQPRIIPFDCGNGCCDYDWLLNGLCPSGGDDSWFQFDYGYSYADSTYVNALDAYACAATGTSQFNVSVEGGGGSWSVQQGYYRYYDWEYDGLWGYNSFESVNDSNNQALHTACGVVDYWGF